MTTERPSNLHPIRLIVHGGAWDIPQALHQPHVEGCTKAAVAARDALVRGGTALDAVEIAVRLLEDDPTFDAGRGSFLNAEGMAELDAIIMDGHDLNLGAVASVRRIRHPITLARLIMTECEHALLVGAGAETFAQQQGLTLCANQELITTREWERWLAGRENETPKDLFGDTVGAVALDAEGNVAVATSTGGTFKKHPGRVGDSPLVGCGGYADNRIGAASATGEGEALMKVVISKTVCDLMAQGMAAQEAADAAIQLLIERTGGRGGLIVLGTRGDVGLAHNTPYLAHAYLTPRGEIAAGIQTISSSRATEAM
jgi:beta-aspartyl-peptidase (threonine type)